MSGQFWVGLHHNCNNGNIIYSWLSMRWKSTCLPVLSLMQTSSPAMPPLASLSTSEPFWVLKCFEAMYSIWTYRYITPMTVISVFDAWFALLADEGVFAFDKTCRLSPGGRGLHWVTCANNLSDSLEGLMLLLPSSHIKCQLCMGEMNSDELIWLRLIVWFECDD